VLGSGLVLKRDNLICSYAQISVPICLLCQIMKTLQLLFYKNILYYNVLMELRGAEFIFRL